MEKKFIRSWLEDQDIVVGDILGNITDEEIDAILNKHGMALTNLKINEYNVSEDEWDGWDMVISFESLGLVGEPTDEPKKIMKDLERFLIRKGIPDINIISELTGPWIITLSIDLK